MGGNAFPNLKLRRIERFELARTFDYIVDTLAIDGFTRNYAWDNVMGSVGKQDSSGDLDFALNNKPARFYGEPELPVFSLREFNMRMRELLGDSHVSSKQIRGGQLQSAWPIEGKLDNGLVQVDFISGDPKWLKFTHWSPGKDVSPWKGVFISTLLGVLAKRHKDYERYETQDGVEIRTARVGLHYDLEKGLYRRWEMQLRRGQGMSAVDADAFETKFADCPRYGRIGHVSEPPEVLRMLFGRPLEPTDVDTFEKAIRVAYDCFDDHEALADRFIEALMRSAARNEYTPEEMREALRV